MKLYGTAEIIVQDNERLGAKKIGPKELRQIRNQLQEAFEDAADRVLEDWKIYNEEVHTVLVGEIEREEE